MGIIDKPEHGSWAWLKLRHRDLDGLAIVSASEAAAVHDEHKYLSKFQLGALKLAADPVETETSRAMERGNRLEDTLIRWVGDELGVELKSPRVMFTYYAGGMIATLDAIDRHSYTELYVPAGADSWSSFEPPEVVVEIKTLNRPWDGVLPRYWYWQGVQQAVCAHVDQIVWGVFDSTLDLHIHIQTVTTEEKTQHVEAVRQFLEPIRGGFIPAEWPPTYEDTQVAFPDSNGLAADLSEYGGMFGRLREIQLIKKTLADEEDLLKGQVGQLLGANEVGTVGGQQVVSWKAQSRRGFDQKRFAQDYPDLYSEYQSSSTFRVMRFKGEK